MPPRAWSEWKILAATCEGRLPLAALLEFARVDPTGFAVVGEHTYLETPRARSAKHRHLLRRGEAVRLSDGKRSTIYVDAGGCASEYASSHEYDPTAPRVARKRARCTDSIDRERDSNRGGGGAWGVAGGSDVAVGSDVVVAEGDAKRSAHGDASACRSGGVNGADREPRETTLSNSAKKARCAGGERPDAHGAAGSGANASLVEVADAHLRCSCRVGDCTLCICASGNRACEAGCHSRVRGLPGSSNPRCCRMRPAVAV
jgi:hypothetical protein